MAGKFVDKEMNKTPNGISMNLCAHMKHHLYSFIVVLSKWKKKNDDKRTKQTNNQFNFDALFIRIDLSAAHVSLVRYV